MYADSKMRNAPVIIRLSDILQSATEKETNNCNNTISIKKKSFVRKPITIQWENEKNYQQF